MSYHSLFDLNVWVVRREVDVTFSQLFESKQKTIFMAFGSVGGVVVEFGHRITCDFRDWLGLGSQLPSRFSLVITYYYLTMSL